MEFCFNFTFPISSDEFRKNKGIVLKPHFYPKFQENKNLQFRRLNSLLLLLLDHLKVILFSYRYMIEFSLNQALSENIFYIFPLNVCRMDSNSDLYWAYYQ